MAEKTAESLLPQAAQDTLHELRVHQIELETQNEELRRLQLALDIEREQYFDLYDTAPVGYCTVSEAGLTLKANLTAARLLGVPRSALVNQRFSRFLSIEDQDIYYLHRKQLIATGKAQECELHILTRDGPVVWVKLMFTLAPRHNDRLGMRVVLIDISKRKFIEQALAESEESRRNSEEQMHAQIRQLAFLDPLTQLPNRRLFMDRLGQAITAGQRTAHFGALIFLDLDNFKPLNDHHGHDAGDILLIEVANRLNLCVRETDTVARMGGDEFVVLLGGLNTNEVESTEQALGIAEKVRMSLAAPYALTVRNVNTATSRNVEHRCSASIGVAMFSKDDQNPDDILKRADAAMYQAKDRGRNLVHIFGSPQ
jgi:diguanylate cyclase (GGDEF)-like protein/PAS domain S-box-containing protein